MHAAAVLLGFYQPRSGMVLARNEWPVGGEEEEKEVWIFCSCSISVQGKPKISFRHFQNFQTFKTLKRLTNLGTNVKSLDEGARFVNVFSLHR